MFDKIKIEKILSQQIVELAQTECVPSIDFAPRKNGKLRFCVNYRMLNAVVVQGLHPMRRMNEYISPLVKAAIYSRIKENSRVWQVENDEKDEDKIAFNFATSTKPVYLYTIWVTPCPRTFQRTIDLMPSRVK